MIDTEKLGSQHNWKPLPDAEAKRVMAEYEAALPEWAKKEGDIIPLYSKKGTLISNGYNRIVIGHYGAYVEMTEAQIVKEGLKTKPKQEWRMLPKYEGVKYYWLCPKEDESIKVYLQKGTVSYADYKVGMYYIAPEHLQATAEPPPAPVSMASSASVVPFSDAHSKVFVITGHRPKDLGRDNEYNIFSPVYDDIRGYFAKYFQAAIDKYGIANVTVISGMAQGVDQIAAAQAIAMGIKLHAYIPYRGQEKSWTDPFAIKTFMDILAKATITDVGEGVRPSSKEVARDMLLARNRAMVDDGDQVLAVFNGNMSGGTAACIRYAIKKGVYVTAYNPINRKITNDLKI